jgi:hypothetical protein
MPAGQVASKTSEFQSLTGDPPFVGIPGSNAQIQPSHDTAGETPV